MAFKKGQSGNPTGKRKGTPNKLTRDIKTMVFGALAKKGGVQYLVKQADENPTAFLALVGKCMPRTVEGTGPDGEHELNLHVTWGNG